MIDRVHLMESRPSLQQHLAEIADVDDETSTLLQSFSIDSPTRVTTQPIASATQVSHVSVFPLAGTRAQTVVDEQAFKLGVESWLTLIDPALHTDGTPPARQGE